MATVRMFKKEGGYHNALEHEVEAMKKDGWVIEDYKPPVKVQKVAEIDELRVQWENKFGKKPHHKKTAETLLKELNE